MAVMIELEARCIMLVVSDQKSSVENLIWKFILRKGKCAARQDE